jgi:hypothetical protein
VPERDDDELALDELRAAWRTLAPDDPSERVDAPDAATQAALDWMRAAWSATAADAPLDATPLRLPWRARWTVARRRARPLLPWLAAAGLLVAVLREVTTPRAVQTIVPVPDPITVSDVIPLTAVDAHRMEMRHGPVRLILVMPTPSTTSHAASQKAEPGSAKELR